MDTTLTGHKARETNNSNENPIQAFLDNARKRQRESQDPRQQSTGDIYLSIPRWQRELIARRWLNANNKYGGIC
eukprot:6192572-Pleurochrysis_carterae.AAC.1